MEKRANADRIETFAELKMAVRSYAGRKWIDSRAQLSAPRDGAVRLRSEVIPKPCYRPRTWRRERVTVRSRLQSRYRDLKTGRFIKKPF